MVVDRNLELFEVGCTSKLDVVLERRGGKVELDMVLVVNTKHSATIDCVWDTINGDGFIDDYIRRKIVPTLKMDLKSAMADGVNRVSTTLPVGKVFFAKTMILDENKDPYPTEPQVIEMLLNTSRQALYRWSRRLAKSWGMKIDMLYHAVFDGPCNALYLCHDWDVAKGHIRDIRLWIDANPMILEFAGGEPPHKILQKWSTSYIEFVNGSIIACRSAAGGMKLAGKGPDRLYRDEMALYPQTVDVQMLSIMQVGQYRKDRTVSIVASAPYGDDNLFERLCFDDNLSTGWDVDIRPMCLGDPPVTFDDKGQPVFHGIQSTRVTQEELRNEWWNQFNGDHARFMEQFQLIPASIEDQAIPLELIAQFFCKTEKDETRIVRKKYTSEKPCILSYDLGESSSHRSVICILEIQDNGEIHLIRTKRFNPGHPIRTRLDKRDLGVIEHIPEVFAPAYNIQYIIGDATTMGTEDHCNDLAVLMEQANHPIAPANIIPYKWAGKSEKHLGKAPLWFNVVKKYMEMGMLRGYYDENLEWEMKVWCAIPSASGQTTLLKSRKQTYSDDIITTLMQGAYVAFVHNGPAPSETVVSPKGLYSGRPIRDDNKIQGGKLKTMGNKVKRRPPRWRRD